MPSLKKYEECICKEDKIKFQNEKMQNIYNSLNKLKVLSCALKKCGKKENNYKIFVNSILKTMKILQSYYDDIEYELPLELEPFVSLDNILTK